MRVYYLGSFGPGKLRQQYELVVNRNWAGFHGAGLNLSARASTSACHLAGRGAR